MLQCCNLTYLRSAHACIRKFTKHEYIERTSRTVFTAVIGMACSDLVKNRWHLWMIKQALYNSINIAVVCHVGNPSRVKTVSIEYIPPLAFYRYLQALVLQHRTSSSTEMVTGTSSF